MSDDDRDALLVKRHNQDFKLNCTHPETPLSEQVMTYLYIIYHLQQEKINIKLNYIGLIAGFSLPHIAWVFHVALASNLNTHIYTWKCVLAKKETGEHGILLPTQGKCTY